MPRKATRSSRSTMVLPVTFSPFARSVANLTSASTSKRQRRDMKLHESSARAPDDEFVNHTLEEKNEQSESSEEEDFEGVIQADFAFFDPKPGDFHGVKILLQNYLDNEQWDLSGFVDLILGQTTVGTVVKLEDDEDNGLFSVVTALNLGRYKDHKCITEVKEFLTKVCQDKNVMDDLRLFLEEQAHDVGLLISQRVFNLPPQLLPPLYDALFDEILWATEDEPTEELRKAFCFKSYLIVSRIYKHKNADHKKGKNSHNEELLIYVKPEDEIFHKLCKWSFYFPLHSENVTTHELRNYRLTGLVMAVDADKVSNFKKELHSLIDES
ncbi:protein BCCIP homolog [Jatropha curcas]|nr:protein BCCIP homolog [Jatropha curcas]XP_037495239.1 protein BCCIP homolog [Jatropha curcas]XP_037495240.1 protein BCCIP homolog [Jatropha curcas]